MGDVRIAQPQTRADELENRLIDFAVRIIKLSANLPKTPAGRHIAGQILRSGTSPAPNYGEARGAESNADFVHKLAIVLKELNETSIWLRVIERSQLLKRELLSEIIGECRELSRIFTSSLKTAKDGFRKHLALFGFEAQNLSSRNGNENGKWQMANLLLDPSND